MKRSVLFYLIIIFTQLRATNIEPVWSLSGALRLQDNPTSIVLIKLDSLGDVLWTNEYYEPDVEYRPWHVFQTNRREYMITGTGIEHTSTFIFALKTDSTGNKLWDIHSKAVKTYQDDIFEDSLESKVAQICSIYEPDWSEYFLIERPTREDTIFYSLRAWNNDCYGDESSLKTVDSGLVFIRYGSSAIHVTWLDKFMKGLRNKSYKLPYFCLYQGISIKPTPDEGYIIAGAVAPVLEPQSEEEVWCKLEIPLGLPPPSTKPTHSMAYVLKIDSMGDTLWTRTYGGNESGIYDFSRSITPTSDGGYILLVKRMIVTAEEE
jgi:hypothetical protein